MKKTFLQIIPALGTGGAEQACVDIAAALVRRGDRALVISSGGRRVDDLIESGGEHITAPVNSKNPYRIFRNAMWLSKIIRRERVGVVHARSRAPAWSAKLACLWTGCPFVTTFHAAYNYSSSIKKKYNAVMASGDRVIAISDFIARHIKDSYGVSDDRLRVINRGIDLQAFNPENVDEQRKEKLRLAWKIGKEERIVLLPARLSPIKGHVVLIEAMALLKALDVPLPLALIVGDDQGRDGYTKELVQKIQETNLSDRIRLVGPCADMPVAYAVSSLVLAPSKVPEGFGRTPVEAMAMGVPVIASSLGATLDTVLDGKTGWLLPPDDPVLWANKMAEALSMDEKARANMARAARARVEALFSDKGMIEKTLLLYDEVLK